MFYLKCSALPCEEWSEVRGVLSPKLFTVVLDGLFHNLLQSGVGCRIDNIFARAFGYADDIVLLAPSAHALKIMISI